MGRPLKDPNAPATRDRILQAASAAFAEHGFAGTTLAQVARTVGITRPSLLHHVPTKDALYRAVVEAAFADLGAALAGPLASDGPYRERLEALARGFGGFVEQRPEVARIVVRELLAEGSAGQAILLEQVAPLLEGVAAFVEAHGAERLAPGVSARAALMTVVSEALLRGAAGSLRAPLWGTPLPELTWTITQALLWRELT